MTNHKTINHSNNHHRISRAHQNSMLDSILNPNTCHRRTLRTQAQDQMEYIHVCHATRDQTIATMTFHRTNLVSNSSKYRAVQHRLAVTSSQVHRVNGTYPRIIHIIQTFIPQQHTIIIIRHCHITGIISTRTL